MTIDEKYMSRCLELAFLAKGAAAPNPMVGAVIVHQNKVIGEGYHQFFGEAHAEVNAINSVEDHSLLKESCIYVSLEPCAHHGKTPPCADLIVEKGFKRVVIGCTDSFSEVSGKGAKRIQKAGIEVEIGVLEKRSRELNKRFFTFHEKKRPFIFLKWAQTQNGLIDQKGSPKGEIDWISAPEIKPIVHQWRSENMAILVGRSTVEKDNPSLTVRQVNGDNPIRIILDSNCQLDTRYKVFNDEAKTIIFNLQKTDQLNNVFWVQINDMTPNSILSAMYQQEIQSVMIEGGSQTLQSFIDANLWDEAVIIHGQHNFDQGTEAPKLNSLLSSTNTMFGDQLKLYKNS